MNERVARLMEQNAEIENIKVRVVELTGEPGDAVLCHPLIVHARSQNAAKVPRFMLAKRIWREQPRLAASTCMMISSANSSTCGSGLTPLDLTCLQQVHKCTNRYAKNEILAHIS